MMIIKALISDGEGAGCPICKATKLILSQAKGMLNALGYEIEIEMLNMDASGPEGEVAVDFAIDNGLTLVPSTVVGNEVFELDDFITEDIINAVKRQNKPTIHSGDATSS
jgi:hypothetical protein